MANTKLLKVMDYLINEQEDKAKELLHQIFIEKARAIHEEMMKDDMEEDEHMLGGDEGHKLADQIRADLEEIEGEETHAPMEAHDDEDHDNMDMEDAEEDLSDELEDMPQDTEDMDDMEDVDDVEVEVDQDMDMDQEAADMPSMEDEAEKIQDLEQAIAELKAEFEALKGGDMEADHEDADMDTEDKMDEAWESDMDLDEDEDYDALDESLELDTVTAAKGGEVGSGKFAPVDTNKHSPVPHSQTDMMGARPVKTGQGAKASGFDRQSAPDSKSMNLTNRRKDAEDGKRPVSKEGDSAALLNKGTSAGFGSQGTKSPISGR